MAGGKHLRENNMRERLVRAAEGSQSGFGRRAAVDLVVTVKAIRGRCPVYKVGDRIVLREGYRLDLEGSDAVCMHSLASVMPYYNAIFRGVKPEDLGLADAEGQACVQCLDPCEETGGGTVILRLTPK